MRIKDFDFRIWDNTIKAYVKYPIQTGEKEYLIFPKDGHLSNFLEVEIYIGLKDKNGSMIFEGDIVEIDGKDYVVIFKSGCFIFSHKKLAWAFHPQMEVTEGRLNFAEVKGNIHEGLIYEPVGYKRGHI